MREHWKYQGAEVPQGLHKSVDGKRCYRYRHDRGPLGYTILNIPIDAFWP
jgi:hypothetical protein